MKSYKSDQLVVSVPPLEGMALRETAEELHIGTASLLRLLIDKGLKASQEIEPIYIKNKTRLSLLTDLQLLEMKTKPTPKTKNKTL
jgi:hypothetical protein